MDLTVFFTNLTQLINDGSFLPWAAGLVLLVTQIIKRFLPTNPDGGYKVSPAVIALFIQVLVWAAYAVANHYGYGQNVQDFVGAATKIIEAIISVLPQTLLGAAVTKVAYDKLTNTAVPGFRVKASKAA